MVQQDTYEKSSELSSVQLSKHGNSMYVIMSALVAVGEVRGPALNFAQVHHAVYAFP